MEFLSTLLSFLLLLGFSAARPYADYAHSNRTLSTSTTSICTTTTLSSSTKCKSSTATSKSTSCSSSSTRFHHGHHNKATTTPGYEYHHSSVTSVTTRNGYYSSRTTEMNDYGDKISSTTMTSSTSKDRYPDYTSASTYPSASVTTSDSTTSQMTTTSTGSTTVTTTSATTTYSAPESTETISSIGPDGEEVFFEVYRDSTISGNEIDSFILLGSILRRQSTTDDENQANCAQACADNVDCEAWETKRNEQDDVVCSLKNNLGASEEEAGTVSGIRFTPNDDGGSTTTSTAGTTTSTSSSSSTTSTSSSTTLSVTSTTRSSTTSTSSTSSTTSSSTTTSSACTPSPTAGSGKRGLSYNYADATDLFSSTSCSADTSSGSSKVSWAYNWYSAPHDPQLGPSPGPLHPNLQFVPMLWSAHPDLTSVWRQNVAAAGANGWTDLLAFNEPDLCVDGAGASCIAVDDAVEAYREWISPLKADGYRLGAPAVTNGQGLNVGNDWLVKFFDRCSDCNIDFLPIHWYGGPNDFDSFFNHLYYTYANVGGSKYPIWITEFGLTGGTDAEVQNFMRIVMAELDRLAFVERYAWFMAGRPGTHPGNLVNSAHTSLTSFGELYDKF